MPRRYALLLAAVAALVAGCDIDDSAPSRPRTGSILTPSTKAQENAERRSLEPPPRQLPVGGAESPGQSALPVTDPPIAMLSAVPGAPPADAANLRPSFPGFPIKGFYGPSGWDAIGHTFGPVDTYTRDTYPALVPHIPPNPGSVPMKEATLIPGGDWAFDWSWGQGLVVMRATHRDWRPVTAIYQVAGAAHNPTYYFDLQKHIDMPPCNATYLSELCSAAGQQGWFFISSLSLPALLVLEPPCSRRETHTYSQDPNFLSALAPGGPIAPAPATGSLKWDYPFLNPDGTIKPTGPVAPRLTMPPAANP
jgi:hypothetical protein